MGKTRSAESDSCRVVIHRQADSFPCAWKGIIIQVGIDFPVPSVWETELVAGGEFRNPAIEAPTVTLNPKFRLAGAFTDALNAVDLAKNGLRNESQIDEMMEEERRRWIAGCNPSSRLSALRLCFQEGGPELILTPC